MGIELLVGYNGFTYRVLTISHCNAFNSTTKDMGIKLINDNRWIIGCYTASFLGFQPEDMRHRTGGG